MSEIKKAFCVVGMKERIDPKNQGQDLMNVWSLFWSSGVKDQLCKKGENPLAIYHNYLGDEKQPYDILVGARNEKKIENLVSLQIPEQEYIIFEKSGKMPEIVFELWKEIWESEIERTFEFDIEEYPDMNTVKISIGVKKSL